MSFTQRSWVDGFFIGPAQGASVSASDISGAMANEARSRYEALVSDGATAPQHKPVFEAKDLESLQGKWDTVTCLDVLIHYDQVSLTV